jgi:hypothetical protein
MQDADRREHRMLDQSALCETTGGHLSWHGAAASKAAETRDTMISSG